MSKQEPGRRAGGAGSPRAASAGARAPAIPARNLLSPRLSSPTSATNKERAHLTPGPKYLSRSTPAKIAAQLGAKQKQGGGAKHASSGEQASSDEEKEEQEEEPEAPEEPGDSQGDQSPTGDLEDEREAGDQDHEGMLSPGGTPPKSEEDQDNHGQGGTTDGGQGGTTDGGGSVHSVKRRGNRGGKKHRKKSKQDHPDWNSSGSWNRVPGSASGSERQRASGSGSDGSWKHASRNYTREGGYMQTSRKARGWG